MIVSSDTSESSIEIVQELGHENLGCVAEDSDCEANSQSPLLSLEAIELGYEVGEKGLEWWQKLGNFQMPWTWCDQGAGSSKVILNDVSFKAHSGQMLAILGSSGSGKTTLLDVISCHAEGGHVFGEVQINGERLDGEVVKKCTAYVRQDDRLIPHLSVRETLTFVARLKLPAHWTKQQIKTKVDDVIGELGLRHVASSKVGGEGMRGISGGERRRVSIGVQLLVDPAILLLDEPTSGLDAFTAHYLVETLGRLASNNRIVLLSIHQPRSDIFALFDQMMLLSGGQVVYYGLADQMVDYFACNGYPCPEFSNPCDFYVDLCTLDTKTESSHQRTSDVVHGLVNLYQRSQTANVHLTDVRPSVEPCSTAAPPDGALSAEKRTSDVEAADPSDEDKMAVICSAPDALSATTRQTSVKSHPILMAAHRDKPGAAKQFSVLIERSLRSNLEDYGFLFVQGLEALMMSLLNGLVFYNLSANQLSIRDRFGLLYIISALYPYMSILDVIGKYYKDRYILYFEMKDGLYRSAPYFFSKVLSDLPEHTLFVLLYVTPMYFISGLQASAALFFQHLGVVYIVVLCSRSLALWAGSVMPTYQMAVVFAQLIFTCFLFSSGFIFNLENLFAGVKWLSYISYIKWGFQALCQTEFIGLNFTCAYPLPDVCVDTGQEALAVYALDTGAVWWSCAILLAEITVFLTLFFVALRFVSQKPHQT